MRVLRDMLSKKLLPQLMLPLLVEVLVACGDEAQSHRHFFQNRGSSNETCFSMAL